MNLKITTKRTSLLASAALALALLQGCASGPGASRDDPFEPFNRSVFRFNEGLDRVVLKPVATAYRDVAPEPIRNSVTNFFENVSDLWSAANNVLQGKPREGVDSLARFGVNTFLGVGGLFDIAGNKLKIPKHKEDFGQTLGTWGMDTGPYLVLPLLGSSSVRDTIGLVVDAKGNLVTQASNVPVRNSLTGLRLVDTRANLLEAGNLVDAAALDKYTFSRDVYLHRRQSLIREELPPAEERFDLPEGVPPAGTAGTRTLPPAPVPGGR